MLMPSIGVAVASTSRVLHACRSIAAAFAPDGIAVRPGQRTGLKLNSRDVRAILRPRI